MKAYLVRRDGSREEIDAAPCRSVLKVDRVGDRFVQVTFEVAGEVEPGGPLIYNETASEDITARVREAGEQATNDIFRRMGLRRPAPGVFANGYFPGETEDEHTRRVRLMHGEDPDASYTPDASPSREGQ